MKKQLEQRLEELKAEFQKGQNKLQELESETQEVRNTLLRIAGAVQVLEEEIGKANQKNGEVITSEETIKP